MDPTRRAEFEAATADFVWQSPREKGAWRPPLVIALAWLLAACAGDPIPASRSPDDPSSTTAPEAPEPPRPQTLRTDVAPQFVEPASGSGHEHGHGEHAAPPSSAAPVTPKPEPKR